jgi:hypothetical protein
MIGRGIAVLLFLALNGTGVPPAGRSPYEDPLALRLSKVFGEKVETARRSPDGGYVAVVLEEDLALTTSSGKVVWRRPKTAVNRWLTGYEIGAAAAPSGRRFAVSGTSGFRNVLLLNGSGRELAYLSTRGTPQTVTFDHRGKRLAAGTASGYVYVVDLPSAGPGSLTYPPAFDKGAVHTVSLGGIVSGLEFSPDDRYLTTTGSDGSVALMDQSGKVLWRHKADFARLTPSRDWQRFVLCDVPSHGPFYGSVTMLTRSGQELWGADYRDPQAAISPDDQFVLLLAAPGDPPADPENEPPVQWRVLDQHGHELRRTGRGDNYRFSAADGTLLTLHGTTWTATKSKRTLWTTRTDFYASRTD